MTHVDSLMHGQESHLNLWFKDNECYGTGGGATLTSIMAAS